MALGELIRPIRRALGRLIILAGVLALALPAGAQDDPLLVTLNEVKARYRNGEWGEAMVALRRLSELAAAPEREAVREKILPALSFYTGAVKYELRDEAGARDSFETYLRFVPDATLDPAVHAKKLIAFFEKVKKEMREASLPTSGATSPAAIEGGVLPAYTSFALDESAADDQEKDPGWGEGPARFLFVGDEARRWKALVDEDARRRFQDEFWARRDPTPATPENEMRIELARRVQYADASFSTETMKGSVSDRGMVFLLLGPPSYVARSKIQAIEDGVGFMRATERKVVVSKGMTHTVRADTDTPRVGAGDTLGEREVWYYRSDRLSRELPWRELRFEFQSKEGYGSAVLQKDPANISALSRMAKAIANPN